MKKSIIIFLTVGIMLTAIVLILLFFLVLYPVKYKNLVTKYATEFNVSQTLVFSIINAESGFDKNAVSRVGAVGLMQLMPTTAKEVAEKLNEPYDESMLKNAETNIKFGCYYLSYLLNMFDNNVTNAVAAYNAGPKNVNDWLSDQNHVSNGTLKDIPFSETKKYVKKVNNNIKIYSVLISN